MAENFTRKEFKHITRGINCARPRDVLEPFYYPYLLNVFSPFEGAISSREGITALNATPIADKNIHSIKRLNDYLNNVFIRVLGAGTNLYADNTTHDAFSAIDSGYFGDPLTFVTIQPLAAPGPRIYVGDTNQNRKVGIDKVPYNMGIASPTTLPSAQVSVLNYKVVDDAEATAGWVAAGTAGALTAPDRINTTISKIVYDVGTTGWALIAPATWTQDIQPGVRVNLGGATETVLIESVVGSFASTTIASIRYDSGSSGPCTVTLTDTSAALDINQMIRFDSGGGGDEVVRVVNVMPGQNGVPAFRCSTVNTQSAGKTAVALQSFRANLANTHAAADTVTDKDIHSSITVGVGTISKTVTLDLSVINTLPINDDTQIHISVKLDVPTNLNEGRIFFDVDPTTNDFAHNYFYYPFSPDALSSAAAGSITTLFAQQSLIQQTQIQDFFSPQLTQKLGLLESDQFNTALESPSEPSLPTSTDVPPGQSSTPGTSQWTELRFRVKDLIRIGSDDSRTLRDVAAIRIQFDVSATTVVDFDSWWIGGTGGVDAKLDTGRGAPINYRYVYYNSKTGNRSNPSPPMRNGIDANKQSAGVTVTQSADPQVDKIEIYRTGGALTGDNPWYYVMSVPNTTGTYIDTYPDDVVVRNRQLDFDNFKPFLDTDIPRSGTCNVVGTEITRVSGDNFNAAWPEGTLIIINNVPYTLFAPPDSTTHLSLAQNAGTQTGVSWYITTPRLMGQPLPALFGPYTGGQFPPIVFGCGSLKQPGTVFWTRPGDPDANSAYGQTQVCSASELLVNGCVYNNQVYVWSTENMYVLTPILIAGQLQFQSQKVEGGVGLITRTALTVGDLIYLVSKNGIYASNGGACTSITDETLYPLFPHEGVLATTVNEIVPPSYVRKQLFELAYGQGKLYFTFYGINQGMPGAVSLAPLAMSGVIPATTGSLKFWLDGMPFVSDGDPTLGFKYWLDGMPFV